MRIFALTWLAYAGYYLCRKNLGVIMPLIEREFSMARTDLAHVVFVYSLCYACGQFLMGLLADRFGGRLVAGGGMLVSAAATAAMTLVREPAALIPLQALNGMAQAAGWSALVKMMSEWFTSERRGVVMGWWSTNYALGGFVATTAAAWFVSGAFTGELEWRRGAWMPAAILFGGGCLFLSLARNGPIRHALPAGGNGIWPMLGIARNKEMRIIASAYFLLKLTRYAFLFWLPMYLVERLQFDPSRAGYASSAFELIGFFGVLGAGYLSDHVFRALRFAVGSLMMALLAGACLLPPVAAKLGVWAVVASIGAIGFVTYGPDTLMGGAAVQDLAPGGAAGSGAGFVNGVGSFGQLVSPYAVALTVDRFGWDALFLCFVALSLLGSAILAARWNFRLEAAQ
ncbi:MAG: MFS transporter [Bryobacteraceae bacterium]|nr:MFS transporter [Bryobacteraceae bacterium]